MKPINTLWGCHAELLVVRTYSTYCNHAVLKCWIIQEPTVMGTISICPPLFWNVSMVVLPGLFVTFFRSRFLRTAGIYPVECKTRQEQFNWNTEHRSAECHCSSTTYKTNQRGLHKRLHWFALGVRIPDLIRIQTKWYSLDNSETNRTVD